MNENAVEGKYLKCIFISWIGKNLTTAGDTYNILSCILQLDTVEMLAGCIYYIYPLLLLLIQNANLRRELWIKETHMRCSDDNVDNLSSLFMPGQTNQPAAYGAKCIMQPNQIKIAAPTPVHTPQRSLQCKNICLRKVSKDGIWNLI